jgi:transcriptional regulator with XRE-family HTH domain
MYRSTLERRRARDGRLTIKLRVSQARAIAAAARGEVLTYHTGSVAFREGGKRIAEALEAWFSLPPLRGVQIANRRDNRLRLRRIQAGYPHGTDVAKRGAELGFTVTKNDVYAIESGYRRKPTIERLQRYSRATGIPLRIVVSLLPANHWEDYETRPVSLPKRVWKAIDNEDQPLDETLAHMYGGEERDVQAM